MGCRAEVSTWPLVPSAGFEPGTSADSFRVVVGKTVSELGLMGSGSMVDAGVGMVEGAGLESVSKESDMVGFSAGLSIVPPGTILVIMILVVVVLAMPKNMNNENFVMLSSEDIIFASN